ncbi:MAG: DUF98 domain-containing protein [Candidatus Methanoliparum thermophilum]|uniref:DUF98 domain-containing protein n=1 Tax=Methanoliparum thermophilum TaxID=2491083 RepID=A0A520KQM8_METT2|nr:beta-ribofuranosylaminobenzene 5'-phosphate synthase [Candidatus Methanoliparum sp. LAM-1]RZN63875.1 MAG: DUF98 domain-containing protein [Candidatus Methanoliparum thermophilum]BDC36395.1 hypothetical protein MTLP_10770 [Candidatus Methanoliparum sp. LAM-1]
MIEKIKNIEKDVGKLSSLQKLLLTTDGSITDILEILTGSEVKIETIYQKIGKADEYLAERLNISEGDEINERVVRIYNSNNDKTLIYAKSYAPLKRTNDQFSNDLFKADIPIGKILKRYKIESRREIKDINFLRADKNISQVFGIFENEILLWRNYSIIKDGEVLIDIYEMFPYNSFQNEFKVVIETPSRLHLTLIDLNGMDKRIDGGIGITLSKPTFLLEAKISDKLQVFGLKRSEDHLIDQKNHILTAAKRMLDYLGIKTNVEFKIREDYPFHIGLGAGTQTSLAVGRSVAELFDKELNATDISKIVGRGGTSGIGTASFESGGFILDGGHSFGELGDKKDYLPSSISVAAPPPVIARYNFPEEWDIVIATPNIKRTYGREEVDIFKNYCPIDISEIRELSHIILLKMIPSLLERDIYSFGESINRIQKIGFKKIELDLQPQITKELIELIRDYGAIGAGLSSFGPTVYGITDKNAKEIETKVKNFLEKEGEVFVTKARNFGARVRKF